MTTPALTQQPCKCGARAATECPGQWEAGCDLGANEAHVRVAPKAAEDALKAALATPVEKAAPSAGEWSDERVATLLAQRDAPPKDGAALHAWAMQLVRDVAAQQAAQPVALLPETDGQPDTLTMSAPFEAERGHWYSPAAVRKMLAAQSVADHACTPTAVVDHEAPNLRDKAAQPVAGEPVASIYITPGGEREMDDWRHPLPVGRNILYTAATAPVATDKDSLTVAPAGRLHADGYFTWHRRDGYVMDRRLPCDFYLAPVAAPAPVGLVPLTDEQWLKLRTAKTGQRLRRTHDEQARVEFLEWMRFAEAAHGIKAGKDGAA